MAVRISFIAVIQSVKLIHIGIIKIISNTDFLFNLLFARIYAKGYAIKRHTAVVTRDKNILYSNVPMVLLSVKNPTKFDIVKLPSPFVKA